MAGVCFTRHAARGQEGHVDPQDKFAAGCPAKRKDPLNAHGHLGSPFKVGVEEHNYRFI